MGFMDFLGKLVPFELFKGMAVTGGYFFRRKETIQYPEVTDGAGGSFSRDVRL